jgi:glycosyltransferase involved in cell wall biosynthesis
MAIRVLALLQPDFREIRLTMIGPDKGDGSLRRARRLAERLGVCDHVSFAGGVPKQEVPRWLNQGDIFLNTTNVDNTPVSVLEAMACGLCVVSTDAGGVPYLVEPGQDALLVGREDPEAMACAVRRILQEPGLAQRLSENGRAKVEKLDWSVVLPQWESLLSAVAQG